jgi:CRISPR-associated endonuclease Cas2
LASHYLIAYDVKNSKRRRRCAKVAYSYALGGQKSVLETILNPEELPILSDELLDAIDPKKESIIISYSNTPA